MSDVTEKLQPWREDFKCGGPPRENECRGNTAVGVRLTAFEERFAPLPYIHTEFHTYCGVLLKKE